jgi:hypothetical protein
MKSKYGWIFLFVLCATQTVTMAQGTKHALGYIFVPSDNQTSVDLTYYIENYQQIAATLPASFSWLSQGKVTPAKDQQSCQGCWAFAATGALESKILVAGGMLYDLSEQQQISCNTNASGCCGGPLNGIRYWETHGPLLESVLGFGDAPGTNCNAGIHSNVLCPTSASAPELPFRINNYYTVSAIDVNAIKTSIESHGPALFGFRVYDDFFTYWNNGASGSVYTNKNSSVTYNDDPNNHNPGGHLVLVIGWDNTKNAWLVKNSWGATGGPNGNGTFWMAYSGHLNTIIVAVANATPTWQVQNPVVHQISLSNDARYSGIAVSSMILNKVADIDPADPVIPTGQNAILSFITGYAGPVPVTGLLSDNVQSILEQFSGDGNCQTNTDGVNVSNQCAPSPVNGRFNWALFRKTNINNLLYDIAYWQLQNEYNAAVPLNGDYTHWAVIEGVQADIPPMVNPYPDNYPASFPLQGFWIDDPGKDAASAKSFQPVSRWTDPTQGFFKPTFGAYYEAIIEPPAIEGSISGAASPSEPGPFSPAAAAVQRILHFHLINNADFSTAYQKANTGTSILVTRTDGGAGYYIVPFVKTSGKKVSIIVRLSGNNGQLVEAVYNPQLSLGFPIDPTRPISKDLKFLWGAGYKKDECHPVLAGDLNGNGKVDCADRNILLRARGSCKGKAKYLAEADYDNDGCVTSRDLCRWEQYRRDYERYAHCCAPRHCGSPKKCNR